MKTKKLGKKLILNKDTVANLDEKAMKDVQGGLSVTCRTYCQTICSGVYCC